VIFDGPVPPAGAAAGRLARNAVVLASVEKADRHCKATRATGDAQDARASADSPSSLPDGTTIASWFAASRPCARNRSTGRVVRRCSAGGIRSVERARRVRRPGCRRCTVFRELAASPHDAEQHAMAALA